MNQFHESIPFSLSYEDLSFVQPSRASLHDAQPPNEAMPNAPEPNVYQLPTPYVSFPDLSAAQVQAQTLNPTVNHVREDSPASDPGLSTPQANQVVSSSRSVSTPVRVTRPPNAFLLFNKEMRRQLKEMNPTMKVAEISKKIGESWKNLSADDKYRYVAEANTIKETQRALHPNAMYIRRSKAELIRVGHYTRLKRKNAAKQQSQQSKHQDQPHPQQQQQQHQRHQRHQQQQQQQPPQPTHMLPSQPQQPQEPWQAQPVQQSVGEYGIGANEVQVQPMGSVPQRRLRRDKNPAAPKHPLSAYMWYLYDVRPETMQNFPGSTVSQISKLCAEHWNTMSDIERTPWHKKAQVDKARYAREMQTLAMQLDQPMGRGTRQKYRAAAAAAASTAVLDMSMPPPTSASQQPVEAPQLGIQFTSDTHEQPPLSTLQYHPQPQPQPHFQRPYHSFDMSGLSAATLQEPAPSLTAVHENTNPSFLHALSAYRN